MPKTTADLIRYAKSELALITEEGDEQQDKMNALILSILLKYGYDAFYQGSSEYVSNMGTMPSTKDHRNMCETLSKDSLNTNRSRR